MGDSLEKQIAAGEREWMKAWKRGPTRTRWNQIPLQVGDRAPDFQLMSSTGTPVRLRDARRRGAVVLLFWRHFGCSCGMSRAGRMRKEYASYVEAGASVLIIGQGEPERAAAYARRHRLPCPVLCDPDRKTYVAYDLLEGKPSQILYDAPEEFLRCDLKAGARLQAARHGTHKAFVDSPWQLPGEFVIDRKGIVRLAYRYQFCDDWPDPRVLVAAIKESM